MAPNNNTFWKARSKHGRDLIFKDPEKLKEAAEEYFEWVDSNPIMKAETVRGGKAAGELIEVPAKRPYTIEGLCVFLDIGTSTWHDYKKREDFSGIIMQAENIIFTQKFEGAAVGIFQHNIIARQLGLVDRREETVRKEQPLFGDQ